MISCGLAGYLSGGIGSLPPILSPLPHVQRWGNRTARGPGLASMVRKESGICKSQGGELLCPASFPPPDSCSLNSPRG